MADSGRIVFPDEVEEKEVTANDKEESQKCEGTKLDSNRIVFPDELEGIKDGKASENKATDTNTLEEPPAEVGSPWTMVTAPPNCPPGQQMGEDGVCRDVF